MKGIPNNPVECLHCHKINAAPKDGLCHHCRPLVRPSSRQKYFFTSEMDTLVRGVWTAGYSLRERGRKARELSVRWNFPHYIVKMRAQRLGLTHDTRKPWTREDVEFLDVSAGLLTSKQMAKKLRRGVVSVQSKLEELKISRRMVAGMSSEDLVAIFGVAHQTVARWEPRCWLFRDEHGRFPDEWVRTFIEQHPEQYDLQIGRAHV